MAVCVTPPDENYVAYTDGGTAENFNLEKRLDATRKQVRLLMILLGLLAFVSLALLAVAIVLGIRQTDTQRTTDVLAGGVRPETRAFLSTSSNVPDGFIARALDPSTGAWASKASLPAPAASGVSDASAVKVEDEILLMGGHVGNATAGNQVTDATFVYTPLTDSFAAGPSLPVTSARGGAAYDAQGGTVYYVGGVSRGTAGTAEAAIFGGAATPCLFALNVSTGSVPVNGAWESLPCMNTPRSDFCAASVAGRLYVIGGLDADFAALSSIEMFDPATEAWTTLGLQLPVGTLDCGCAAVGNVIYVVAGVDTDNFEAAPSTFFTDAVWAVDVVTRTVQPRAALPRARGDVAVAAVTDGALLAIGGETFDNDDERTLVGTHEVFQYSVPQDAWAAKVPLPGARFRASAAAVRGGDGATSVAVFGGHTSCETATDFTDPDSDGGCDEIASTLLYVGSAEQLVFIVTEQ